ncbi:MAG: acyl-CoA synthetase /AMP-acid ligase II [Acidobacteria bacterium OLB17]|nr:MAG: acyl-CoA synthetase /AMP-acid ligase II [Acidobacteria bacterium OLB17]
MSERNENIRNLLQTRVLEHGEKTFLTDEASGRSYSYRTFLDIVERTASTLGAHGIRKGDVVSLLLPNSAEYVIAYFACWTIGAIAGPINSLLKPEEIEWTLGNSESKLLLIASAFLPQIEGRKTPPHLIFDDATAVGREADANPAAPEIDANDDAVIIYTSGTTGKPKGCLLTHANLIANARQIVEWLGFGPDDRLLSVMPLFHMNAVSVTTMSALYAGGSTIVTPKFSASRFWEIVERYRITSFGSVATMLSMLLAKKSDGQPAPSNSLRFAMCGSAPVPVEVLNRFEETFGCLVVEGYGLSESTCRSTFNPPNKSRRPGSCGLPIGNEMAVFDDSNNPVADGELGEIVLRGPNIFRGYFKNEAATKKAFEGGWFHTGDIGYRDADGFYFIADRKSDMVIRGGENIYPREIDELLFTHPAIAAAAVIGVPDEIYGEEVEAFVVLRQGHTASENEIIDFCRSHLADYKCPKRIHFLDEIPKGPTGKLLKRKLAKLRLAERS